MKIEILGPGCDKCKKLTLLTEEVLKENNIEAELLKVSDIAVIMNYGVIVTPALVVNGEVKVAGRIPSKEEIKKFICN
jgi:small redox-active disulfide protein 2